MILHDCICTDFILGETWGAFKLALLPSHHWAKTQRAHEVGCAHVGHLKHAGSSHAALGAKSGTAVRRLSRIELRERELRERNTSLYP